MKAGLSAELRNSKLWIVASGLWTMQEPSPTEEISQKLRQTQLESTFNALVSNAEKAKNAMESGQVKNLVLAIDSLDAWDSSLLAVFSSLTNKADSLNIPVDLSHLEYSMTKLLELARGPATQASDSPDKNSSTYESGLLEIIGGKALGVPASLSGAAEFLGEFTFSLGRLLTCRAVISKKDFFVLLRECGMDALPIISLVSLLLGLIIAFVGSIQLNNFGAEVYIAAMVGIAIVRVLGPVLTGIVISGRTGANYAAIIGSMQVNEEVDALSTFGISPIDFLVLPRVLALIIMTPLLTIYADIMGIIGGFAVGVAMLDIPAATYIYNTFTNLSLLHLWVGLFHSFVFGFVISLCGCYHGINSKRNAEGVGRATTAAVVNSIVGIIVSTSIITLVLTVIAI